MKRTERFTLKEYQKDSFVNMFRELCAEANTFPPNPFTFDRNDDLHSIEIDREIVDKLDQAKINDLPFIVRHTIIY